MRLIKNKKPYQHIKHMQFMRVMALKIEGLT
jgi:hypothetical protein